MTFGEKLQAIIDIICDVPTKESVEAQAHTVHARAMTDLYHEEGAKNFELQKRIWELESKLMRAEFYVKWGEQDAKRQSAIIEKLQSSAGEPQALASVAPLDGEMVEMEIDFSRMLLPVDEIQRVVERSFSGLPERPRPDITLGEQEGGSE
jgi:hypothetical protein